MQKEIYRRRRCGGGDNGEEEENDGGGGDSGEEDEDDGGGGDNGEEEDDGGGFVCLVDLAVCHGVSVMAPFCCNNAQRWEQQTARTINLSQSIPALKI